MQRKVNKLLGIFVIFCAIFSCQLQAQSQPNTNGLYEQLRSLKPAGDGINVGGLTLKRDAAVFTFKSGSFAFYAAVNGKETGAVFIGSGHLHITPPTEEERHNLQILNHTNEFDEDFDEGVFRFTDGTAAELRKASAGQAEAKLNYAHLAEEFHTFQRQKLHENFDLRILEDVLSPAQGGFFLAAIHARKNPHLLFIVDPHGASEVAPEEIALHNWSEWGDTILLAFHFSSDAVDKSIHTSKEVNATAHSVSSDLDVSIEKSGFLTGLATLKVEAQVDGVAVVPFELFPTLRVSKVEAEGNTALDFIQEKKDEDPDFGVILKSPLKKGDTVTLRIAYGGKDAVKNVGGQNYYPVARESWFPNTSTNMGDYRSYHMTFHVPAGLELIATGSKVNEKTEGKVTTTEWQTKLALPVVGFTLGKFAEKDSSFALKDGTKLTLAAYANRALPDSLNQASDADLPQQPGQHIESSPVGTLDTTQMLPVILSEGTAAAQIYTDYFGPIPFDHISLTQQNDCDSGQSWPMLVYLPICGFLDQTQQHVLGADPGNMYWKIVTPHETAHQWWGQTVGFGSYRDQWMSEGFADESASIFLQLTSKKPDAYRSFWKEERRLLTEKNQYNFRAIDVGPVTMGVRLASPKAGWNIYQDLVYPKGAYILHMVRQMMWNPQEGEARFKATMHDFISTHKLQSATTEDFKASVEKFMTPGMDLDGNHKMDWFFNEYVYGTALPNYHFEESVTHDGDVFSIHFKLTQSNVTDDFKMAVPLYLELENGNIIRLGSANVKGNKSVEQSMTLPKLPSPAKHVLMNYFYDVLCTEN